MRVPLTWSLFGILLAGTIIPPASADAPDWYYDSPQVMFDPDGPPPWRDAGQSGHGHQGTQNEPRGYHPPHGIASGTCRLNGTGAPHLLLGRVHGPVGQAMMSADQACLGHALEYGANRTVFRWKHAGGPRFTIHINGSIQSPKHGYCRAFTVSVLVDGLPERTSEAACRQSTGRWRLAQR